jgi:hypothetical protein
LVQTRHLLPPTEGEGSCTDLQRDIYPDYERVIGPNFKRFVAPTEGEGSCPDLKRDICPDYEGLIGPNFKRFVAPTEGEGSCPDLQRDICPNCGSYTYPDCIGPDFRRAAIPDCIS